MKTQFTQEQISQTAVKLGIPDHPFVARRIARAYDLVASNKVNEVSHDEGLYRVHSQYDDKIYTVELNHGTPHCTCPDGAKTVYCKHSIASMMLAQAQKQKASKLTIYDDTFDKRNGKRNSKYGRWIVNDYKVRKGYVVYRDKHDKLHCACGKKNCRHRKAVHLSACIAQAGKIADNGAEGFARDNTAMRIENECGTPEAKLLQEKLNGSNGTAGESQPSTDHQLDVTNPFEECEQRDIDQIEGRSNGDLAYKLSNGEYVISYRGIMKLADKHNVTFEASRHDETHTVIAYGRCGNNSRISGKPANGYSTTAIELAKRNAARMLIPLPEIKALQCKAKLEAEFSWQVAKRKCLEIVPDFTFDILLNDLVRDGKLEQKHSSDYSRKEWLLIFDACKRDVETNGHDDDDGAGNTASSDKFTECREAAKDFTRFSWLKGDMLNSGELSGDWTDDDFDKLKEACEIDASLFGKELGHWEIDLQPNANQPWRYKRRYWFWLLPMSRRCFWCAETEGIMPDTVIEWGRYEVKTSLCLRCSEKVGDGELSKERLVEKFDEIYRAYGGVGSSTAIFPDDTETVPSTESEFVERCKQAEAEVEDTIDDNSDDDAPTNGDGKRKLQMDKKLRTWLVEADGTKTEISCREICEQFAGRFVTQLRAGIDSGGDISTVELD